MSTYHMIPDIYRSGIKTRPRMASVALHFGLVEPIRIKSNGTFRMVLLGEQYGLYSGRYLLGMIKDVYSSVDQAAYTGNPFLPMVMKQRV